MGLLQGTKLQRPEFLGVKVSLRHHSWVGHLAVRSHQNASSLTLTRLQAETSLGLRCRIIRGRAAHTFCISISDCLLSLECPGPFRPSQRLYTLSFTLGIPQHLPQDERFPVECPPVSCRKRARREFPLVALPPWRREIQTHAHPVELRRGHHTLEDALLRAFSPSL